MKPNCKGCKAEWFMACEFVKEGNHLATTIDDRTQPVNRGHFTVIVVDDNGNLVLY